MSAEIRRVIAQWREEADIEASGVAEAESRKDWIAATTFRVRSETLREHANALAALLPALPPDLPKREPPICTFCARGLPAFQLQSGTGNLWHRNEADQLFKCVAGPAPPDDPPSWQPIETAPKDGTQVWTWDAERGSNPALYLIDGETWVITYDDAEIQPTHWMPLPASPAALPPDDPPHEVKDASRIRSIGDGEVTGDCGARDGRAADRQRDDPHQDRQSASGVCREDGNQVALPAGPAAPRLQEPPRCDAGCEACSGEVCMTHDGRCECDIVERHRRNGMTFIGRGSGMVRVDA